MVFSRILYPEIPRRSLTVAFTQYLGTLPGLIG